MSSSLPPDPSSASLSSSPSSSSPSSIRAYFASILTNHYSIPTSDAEDYVSAWKYGKDAEVLSFDCVTYRAIFGDEIGAILFRWKKDYSETVLRRRLDGRKEEEVQRKFVISLIFWHLIEETYGTIGMRLTGMEKVTLLLLLLLEALCSSSLLGSWARFGKL